jgi:hypothetical protein
MARAKAKKTATMRVHCWAGTPNELETVRVFGFEKEAT